MDIGYILIVSILVLGGVIATVGDRLGTRVGKARLSLFNLRPRQTAVVVTIMTGITISASTLGLLFATSKPFRKGVFQLDKLDIIRSNLKTASEELQQTLAQKQQIENELAKARAETALAQKRLQDTNKALRTAKVLLAERVANQSEIARKLGQTQSQLKSVSNQTVALRSEIEKLEKARVALIDQRERVKAEIEQLKTKVNERDREIAQKERNIKQREQEIKQKDRNINERDRQIAQQDRNINERDKRITQQDIVLRDREVRLKETEKQLQNVMREREARLKQLATQLVEVETKLKDREKQLVFRQQEVSRLEQYLAQYSESYQELRGGNVALLRGDVLAYGVVRIVDPLAARQAVDQLLSEAQRIAIKATRANSSNNNNNNDRVLQITREEVEEVINKIKDGRPYLVRIISAGNYVMGEKQVQVFAEATFNQLVFKADDVVATIAVEPRTMTEEEIRKILDQLIGASTFRARRAGILGNKIQIGDDVTTLVRFIEQLKQYNQPVDLQAVVAENSYTAGPLKMKLVAVKDGKIVFST